MKYVKCQGTNVCIPLEGAIYEEPKKIFINGYGFDVAKYEFEQQAVDVFNGLLDLINSKDCPNVIYMPTQEKYEKDMAEFGCVKFTR